MLAEAPALVFRLGVQLEDIFPFLRNTVASSSKLSVVREEQGKLRMDLCKGDRTNPTCLFRVTIMPDRDACELHFTPIRKEDPPRLANAVAAVVLAISQYTRLMRSGHAHRKFGVTESDIERIATFLQVNGQSTIGRIADALEMEQFIVALCLNMLVERGIVSCTPPSINPRKYFLK